MPASSEKSNQGVLIKLIACHREHKMHLNVLTKHVTMPERTQNISQLEKTPPTQNAYKKMCCPTLRATKRNSFQRLLTKTPKYQRGHKMTLNTCWLNLIHANEETIYISTCDYQTHHLQEKALKVSQLVMIESPPCQWGQKVHFNMCWSNTSHASEDPNASEHKLIKPIIC